jgi:hypothetical protein
MGEVGVNPEQVGKAAAALEQLRDALAANVPTIVNTMSSYNAGVNTAALKQAQAQSVGDAADMRARYNLAEAWMANPANIDVAAGGIAFVPWDGAALDNADAQYEASQLAAAENGGDPKANAATIKSIQQDIKDHMNDPAWLGAFYNDAAPYVAKLATTLHNLDVNSNDENNKFTVLTKDDQGILATYAQGLAVADKSGKLSADTVQAIGNAPDIWSASMLIKFGPPGSSWAISEPQSKQNPDQLSLLAVLTDNVYRDMQNGTIKVPLGGGHYRYTSDDEAKLQDTLNQYDPLSVMLKADTQNKNAAWQVMGDDKGAYGNPGPGLAKLLLWNNNDLPDLYGRYIRGAPDDHGQYPGFFTLSPAGRSVKGDPSWINMSYSDVNITAAFLDAATSAPRGPSTDAMWSARSALNIIEGTPPAKGGFQLDPKLQKALTNTAQRYLLDLGMSTVNGDPSAVVAPSPVGALPAWNLQIRGQGDNNPLSNFLSQITSNKDDLATLNAAAKVDFSNIYAQAQLGKLPPELKNAAADDAMVRLLARIDTAANGNGIDLAKDLDEQHDEYNKMIQFAEDSVFAIDAINNYEGPFNDALGLLGIPTQPFSTDNAVNAQTSAAQHFAEDATQLHIPMVQALINNNAPGLLHAAQLANAGLPPDKQWLKNGQIVLTAQNGSEFNAWYQGNVAGQWNLDKIEALYGAIWAQQGATSSPGAPGPW